MTSKNERTPSGPGTGPVGAGVVLGSVAALALAAADARASDDDEPPAVGPPNAPNTSSASIPSIPFERYTLDNGVEVILLPDTSVPLVAVNVWYHVGSSDEVPGQSGFAHLYEHMFKNSKHLGDRHHYDILSRAGSVAANATTNADRTNYYEVVPSNQLELALWLESDRMGYFLGGLSQQRLDKQIAVVRNERRQNYEDRAYGRERLAIAAALYPDDHPRRYLTIGRHADIEAATMQAVHKFYKQWYVPANATVCVGGDFEPARARRLIDKWFGSFPASSRPAHHVPTPPPISGTPRVEIDDPIAKLRRVHYAWHSPAAYAPGDAELDIAAHVLAATGTGRLYRILVVERQLAQRVRAWQRSTSVSGEFHVSVDLRTGADQAQVEAIIDAELARLIREPISERELDRAVTRYETGFLWGLERLAARVNRLQHYNHYTGDPGYIRRDLTRYISATAEGVHETAARYLARDRRVEVITKVAADPGD